MSEYTSLEVSKRLAEAGFKVVEGQRVLSDGYYDGDQKYGIEFMSHELDSHSELVKGKTDTDFFYPAYRADTLLNWLLNEPIFSKRPWSIHIAVVAEVLGDGTLARMYRVVADCGDGSEMAVSANTLPDALAEVVLKVLEVSHASR